MSFRINSKVTYFLLLSQPMHPRFWRLVAFILLMNSWACAVLASNDCKDLLQQAPAVKVQAATLKTSIRVSGLRTSEKSKQLLYSHTVGLLSLVNGHFELPERVSYFEGRSPMYDDTKGSIESRYPMYFETQAGRRLRWSATDSIGIHLHELAHQIVDTHISQHAEDEPEIAWAFKTRWDMHGEFNTKGMYSKLKSKTQFKNKSIAWIFEHFGQIKSLAKEYSEFFADTLAVIYLQDPDAIYKSLFPKKQNLLSPIHLEILNSHSLRRFDVNHDIEYIEKERKFSEHAGLALARTYVWRKIFVEKAEQGQKIPSGEVARKVFTAMKGSLKDLTQNFQKNGEDINAEMLNQNLIQHLRAEFE